MYRGDVSRRFAAVCAVFAVVVALGGIPVCSGDNSGTFATPFAASSPWRQPIASNPELDPNSAAMIAAVQPKSALFANLVEFGIPIYKASSDTPSHSVTCTMTNWGVCPFTGWPVLIPDGAAPHSGSDGAMVTVDESAGTIFEFWRAVDPGGQWSAGWGAVNSLQGSGWGGAATGSGASRLGGLIRIAEIAAGTIPHALALQTDNTCSWFRAPALKSDGSHPGGDCLPEGARLQLDPTLDLDKMGLSIGELAVARAMQQYGGYVMDVSDTSLSVTFELDTSAPGRLSDIYKKAGFRWDYDAMEHIPWEKLRVLK